MSATQISIQNVTPQERRFFVLSQELATDQVNTILMDAWDQALLKTGEIAYSAFSSVFQLVAQGATDGFQNQRVLTEAALGSGWSFKTDDDGTPSLSVSGSAPESSVTCKNEATATTIMSLYNNFSRWTPEIRVLQNMTVSIEPRTELYFYASVAVTDESQPVVLESVVGKATIGSRAIQAQLLLEGSTLRWSIS